MFLKFSLLTAHLFALCVHAHTNVWSVWVNGVDQGTGNGIRQAAFNGPLKGPGSGFMSGPVRDIDKFEMACNVLGEVPNNATIKVSPGDTVTLEWKHGDRSPTDDIIDMSHKGAGLVYISPDPPVGESWVKLQEQGEDPPGTWYTGGVLNARNGMQDVQIPNDLAPGFYLLRGELLTLHEAETSHLVNNHRGIQIYIACIQLQVVGDGTVNLPSGAPDAATFPGVYKYSDSGIVYNIYWSTEGQQYTPPGPPVWTGAAPSPSPPAYGSTVGTLTIHPWSTWIGDGFSDVTLATSITVGSGTQTAVYEYTPSWSTEYVAPSEAIASFSAQYRVRTEAPQVTTPPSE